MNKMFRIIILPADVLEDKRVKLIKATKPHKCKKGCSIWSGDEYYPQRRDKALCLTHGSPSNLLLRWAFNKVKVMNDETS